MTYYWCPNIPLERKETKKNISICISSPCGESQVLVHAAARMICNMPTLHAPITMIITARNRKHWASRYPGHGQISQENIDQISQENIDRDWKYSSDVIFKQGDSLSINLQTVTSQIGARSVIGNYNSLQMISESHLDMSIKELIVCCVCDQDSSHNNGFIRDVNLYDETLQTLYH